MQAAMVALYTAGGVIAACYAVLSWRRRKVTPLALSLMTIMAGAAEWSVAQAFALAAPTPAGAIASSYAIFAGVAAVVGAYYWHATVFAGRPRLGRRRCALLLLHPLFLIVVIATDRWHHLFYRLVEVSPTTGIVSHPGPLYWVHTAYSYILLAFGTALVVRAMRRAVRSQRRLFIVFLASGSLPVLGNLVTLFVDVHAQRFDLTPLLFLVSGIVWWWAAERSGLGRQLVPVTYAQVIAALSDAVMVLDPDGRFLDVNPAATRLLAVLQPVEPGTVVGRCWTDVVGTHFTNMFAGAGQSSYTAPSGAVYDVRVVRMRAADGTCPGTVVVVRDVTELERLRAELTEQAIIDGLTGVYNRRHLTAVLEQGIRDATLARSPLSVVIIDVDHFKSVNDQYGHAVGDRVLIQVARDLAGAVRQDDTVARFGGEEFVVVMPGVDACVAAARANEWRRQRAAASIDTAAGALSLTFSAGVAELAAGDGPDDLLRVADKALYRAKAAGRNRVDTVDEPPSVPQHVMSARSPQA
jgi:diguanylate cyclase (GGDEF)-like protein